MESTDTKDDASTNKLRLKMILQNDGKERTEVMLKVKNTTQFSKIMDVVSQRLGYNSKNLQFLFDGKKIKTSDTPESL